MIVEVSLHHGTPFDDAGNLVNEVAYFGYERQRVVAQPGTPFEVTFPPIGADEGDDPENHRIPFYAISDGGRTPLIAGVLPGDPVRSFGSAVTVKYDWFNWLIL